MLRRVIKTAFSNPFFWRGPGVMLRPQGVYVLMYHRIDDSQPGFHGLGKERFEAQLNWLQQNCTLITPEELDNYLESPPRRRPAVLLTLDDGYRCVHDIVAPALRKAGARALVFLPTGIIDAGGLVWTDRLNWAFQRSEVAAINFSWEDARSWSLQSPAQRRAVLSHCKEHLKKLPREQRLQYEDEILHALGVADEWARLPRQMLDWDEIRATSDVIAWGGHTHTHPILSSLNAREQEEEIATCRARLQDELGSSTPFFAYPNGRAGDFNADSKQLLRKYGFETAFSTEEGVATRHDDRLSIRRVPTTAGRIADFAWLITHSG